MSTPEHRSNPLQRLLEKSWCLFPHDTELAHWVDCTLPAARRTLTAPEAGQWWRCGDTWFAGVNVLPNDERGAVEGGPPLSGAAVRFVHDYLATEQIRWDRGQVSVCFPGYPRPMASESETAFRFRRDQDAAHVEQPIELLLICYLQAVAHSAERRVRDAEAVGSIPTSLTFIICIAPVAQRAEHLPTKQRTRVRLPLGASLAR